MSALKLWHNSVLTEGEQREQFFARHNKLNKSVVVQVPTYFFAGLEHENRV